MNEFCKNCTFKEKCAKAIIKMFYVGHFIVWLMQKRLKKQVIKSWNVLYVMLILWMFLIWELKKENV
jgi:hypothetical protein